MQQKFLFVCLLISHLASAQDSLQIPKFNNYDEYIEYQSAKISGKKFPEFNISSTAGQRSFSNNDLANKVVFVNFWFTNCPPCMAEMKALNQLYDTLKGNRDFVFFPSHLMKRIF